MVYTGCFGEEGIILSVLNINKKNPKFKSMLFKKRSKGVAKENHISCLWDCKTGKRFSKDLIHHLRTCHNQHMAFFGNSMCRMCISHRQHFISGAMNMT